MVLLMKARMVGSGLGVLALGVSAPAQTLPSWGIQLRVNDPGSDLADALGNKVGFGSSLVYHHTFVTAEIPIRARLNLDRWEDASPEGAPFLKNKVDNYGVSVEVFSFFKRQASSGMYYAFGVAGDHWDVRTANTLNGASSRIATTKASSIASFGYLFPSGFSVELSGKSGSITKNLDVRVWSLSVGYRF
jgi:hypothetical protein